MDQEQINAMSLTDLENAINELKAQLVEGISEEERTGIEVQIKDLQDRLEIVLHEVDQAARRAAGLDPENHMMY